MMADAATATIAARSTTRQAVAAETLEGFG